MENVFYNCNVDHVFDLKGSTRSRYVDEDADSGVLMDENLLECVSGAPIGWDAI
jgi:1-phosphatidylinositol-3-phosphate 5-kinase